MTKYYIDSDTLTDIADEIRAKEGSSDPIQTSDMAQRIHDLPSGGISQVQSITINNKASLTNIQTNTDGTYTDYLLDVTVLPAEAPQVTQVTLSNPTVAKVIDNGNGTHSLRVITGGTTTVTVSDYSGTINDSFTMTITVPLQKIAFPYSGVDIETGSTRQLTVNYTPSYASNKTVAWASNSEDITVDQTGLLTASATATMPATITAYNAELDGTISVTANPQTYESDPDWVSIKAKIQAGERPYGIGSELATPWRRYTSTTAYTDYILHWVVMHYGATTRQGEDTEVPCMYLQLKEILPITPAFETEQRKQATEETAQAGVYYYGYNGSAYTPLSYEVGDAIQYELYTNIYKSGIDWSKSMSAYRSYGGSGINWWQDSVVRQYLNSESTVQGFGWQSQHISDTNSTPYTIGGFLSGFGANFVSALTSTKIQTARNTVIWNGETDITYDRVFLPSMQQIYAYSLVADVEGEAWDYYKNAIGTAQPSNNAEASRIKYTVNTSSAYHWWLRSAYRSYATLEYYVSASGAPGNGSASSTYGLAPACVIC